MILPVGDEAAGIDKNFGGLGCLAGSGFFISSFFLGILSLSSSLFQVINSPLAMYFSF